MQLISGNGLLIQNKSKTIHNHGYFECLTELGKQMEILD